MTQQAHYTRSRQCGWSDAYRKPVLERGTSYELATDIGVDRSSRFTESGKVQAEDACAR